MEFENYLTSKHIDSARFSREEPALWQSWKDEFEQVHPNSFTMQKLNLINPIRRKYQLPDVPKSTAAASDSDKPATLAPAVARPAIAKPAVPKPAIAKPAVPGVAKPAVKIPRPMPKPTVAPSAPAPLESSASTPIASSSDGAEPIPAVAAVNPMPPNSDVTITAAATPLSESVTSGSEPETHAGVTPASADKSAEVKSPGNETSGVVKPPRPVIPRPVIKPKPKTD